MSADQLATTLRRIDGKGYGAYKDLHGPRYAFAGEQAFELVFDRVQSDPFALPTRAHLSIGADAALFPVELFSCKVRRTAAADYLTRKFWARCHSAGGDEGFGAAGRGGYGGDKGGEIGIDRPGQHVLERTSVICTEAGSIEARFTLSMPAKGRNISGHRAEQILTRLLPDVARRSLFAAAFADDGLAEMTAHVLSVVDQTTLRGMIGAAGLVAFVRDGAILPRKSGAEDAPLDAGAHTVPFVSPPEMRREFTLPHAGRVQGMGIPHGVSLIVGGGFHGKSTLLKALEVGVYNHVPGDGREFVCCDESAVKIRAEDGRFIAGVDISAFINGLPHGKPTGDFSTDDASGSTSQAAAIIEALEIGATALLIDEDTAATNFMIRDERMRQLVRADPISPFIQRVRALADSGVSTVLVVGGCGDYFEVADHVIMMQDFLPQDATARARAICARMAAARGTGPNPDDAQAGDAALGRRPPAGSSASAPTTHVVVAVADRIVAPLALLPDGKVNGRRKDCLSFGDRDIDLGGVEQIVEVSQVRAIGDIMLKLGQLCEGVPLRTALDKVDAAIAAGGLQWCDQWQNSGNLARPRRAEVAAALNRYRGLRVTQARNPPLGVV